MAEKQSKKIISYRDALKELQEITATLDAESVDVDEVAAKVARAVELIKVCRHKIAGTELEVRKIVKEFEKEVEKNTGTI